MKNTRLERDYKKLQESFGGPILSRTHAPRIKLSGKFVRAFKEEYKRLTTPKQILDEDGEVVDTQKINRKGILERMQKALPFLVR